MRGVRGVMRRMIKVVSQWVKILRAILILRIWACNHRAQYLLDWDLWKWWLAKTPKIAAMQLLIDSVGGAKEEMVLLMANYNHPQSQPSSSRPRRVWRCCTTTALPSPSTSAADGWPSPPPPPPTPCPPVSPAQTSPSSPWSRTWLSYQKFCSKNLLMELFCLSNVKCFSAALKFIYFSPNPSTNRGI